MSNLSQLLPDFGNIYAPQWMGLSPQYPNFRDEEFDIDLPAVSVPAGAVSPVQSLAFDSDADYLVDEFWFVPLPGSEDPINPQDLRVKIRDGDGRLITSDFVYCNDLCGPLVPVLAVRRGSVFSIQYQNASAQAISVQMVIRGYKRFPCENVSEMLVQPYKAMRYRYPKAPAGKEYREFEYFFPFDNTSGENTLYRQPLQTDNDADFVWRGVVGAWGTVANLQNSTGQIAVNLYGPDGLALNQLSVPPAWGSQPFGPYGLIRELLFPNGGARLAPQYPQIRIPAGGILEADVAFVPGVTSFLMFSLRGFKIYDIGSCQ